MPDDNQNNNTNNSNDLVMSKFDEAFNQTSLEVQNYILADEFPKNIALICKLQKLESEKENVIIENVAISILVGLLSTKDAKNTLMESFKISGILIEELNIQMILKDIDAYILAPARKQILESKVTNKNIRHLTLREEREETEREELRKILLENTGNLKGKINTFEYKKISHGQTGENINNLENAENHSSNHNRESLLARINIHPGEIINTTQVKERMRQIRVEEEERLKKLEKSEEAETQTRLAREELEKKEQLELDQKRRDEILEANETSNQIKELLEKNLEEGGENNLDIQKLIQKRETEEQIKEMRNVKKIADQEDQALTALDPYRESV